MKVLAIEISSARGSAAVAENGRVLEERHFECERGRGAEIFSVLEKLRGAWQGIDVIAVGIGPGSYNGLRVACALASSWQMATGAEVRVSPSPCVLSTDTDHFFVCGDARGGRAYRAEVRDRHLAGEIALIPYAEAAAMAGDPVPVFRTGPLPGAEHMQASAPEAAVLALLAPVLPVAEPGGIAPIYLKPPHITHPRGTAT